MAELSSVSVPSRYPISDMLHNITVHCKKNESNECDFEELGTGKLYLTTDDAVWIKDDTEEEQNKGFEFYLSDISELSKEDDAICMLNETQHYVIKITVKSHHNDHELAEVYKTLKRGIKLAKNPVMDEFPVFEAPAGILPTVENIKFSCQSLDYPKGFKSGVATLYFTNESLYLIYNTKEQGPKVGSGYELKDIVPIILEDKKEIQLNTEANHFSVTITLSLENNIEDFDCLCKKIEELKSNKVLKIQENIDDGDDSEEIS